MRGPERLSRPRLASQPRKVNNSPLCPFGAERSGEVGMLQASADRQETQGRPSQGPRIQQSPTSPNLSAPRGREEKIKLPHDNRLFSDQGAPIGLALEIMVGLDEPHGSGLRA